ncbi:HlyD family type I secretion periplasmic adaptor subunit [Bradyrhizobium pachyrhizi]|uniref:HlyD family type I secretion periplasmic adaptor subunit n=1 Tax=Bradyrhizobium TaxID=374 RepID=UPI00067C9984|nr:MULTISPECIES: HlyD family type I secretion periplasmic adaptor subunit [Bradyrhizobium]WFU58956.1 HlyD family type I secretion periplasmic adaptor subunit [Bradyrhizobium pachyrhizi]WOH84251.1 HlyD family type I secretion periplasmic adaptor subunit [Bradyrhizobium sp. BEA-2-5]
MSPNQASLATVRQFQSETDAIREAPEPMMARATLFVLSALLVSIVAIMCLTRLDRVITSVRGKIVPVDQINVLQALDPSIIKTIDVREGEQVDAGQLLATLDSTFTAADVTQYKLQIASLEAQVARDEAELSGKPLSYGDAKDADAARYNALQKALYDQRIAQYGAQVTSYDSKISQTEATILKAKKDDERYGQRAEIAGKIEDMRSTLAESGSGSKLNLYLSQDTRLELLRQIDNTHNTLLEAQHQLDSLRADRKAFIEQWNAQLSQDLVTTRNNLDTSRASYDKAIKHQDLVRWTAAEPSVVLTLAKLSVGSVLKPGDPFITLMPLKTRLEAEIQVLSRDVGFIRPNDPCTLKVDAFNAAEHGTAQGKIRWISEGAFTTDDDGKPVDAYYKARCSVDQTNFTNVPKNFRLIPGMTLQGDVNVGTRSVAMYLLSDMLRGMTEAMREP